MPSAHSSTHPLHTRNPSVTVANDAPPHGSCFFTRGFTQQDPCVPAMTLQSDCDPTRLGLASRAGNLPGAWWLIRISICFDRRAITAALATLVRFGMCSGSRLCDAPACSDARSSPPARSFRSRRRASSGDIGTPTRPRPRASSSRPLHRPWPPRAHPSAPFIARPAQSQDTSPAGAWVNGPLYPITRGQASPRPPYETPRPPARPHARPPARPPARSPSCTQACCQ